MAISYEIVVTFTGIFVLGLMLNLTPCVYPMMAITVSILGQKGESKPGKAFIRALVYVLGMATMYSVLGVAAALSGGIFGSMLQSPAVLLGISLLFIALALSMFGFYELQLPSSLLNKLEAKRSAGFFGLFISGLLVGIFAAPCVGPPVIALLTMVGQRADPLYGFMVFFVLSMGLGLPYLLLGTFSGLLNRLPRSGNWMLWFKKLLGVILLAIAFFYMSLALHQDSAFTLIPLVILIGGLYLGFLDTSVSGPRPFRYFKFAAGIIMIGLAIYGWNLGQLQSISWQNYSSRVEDTKPAALYFSAGWCVPCLELDRKTFTDKRVIKKFSEFNRYKVDLTNYDSAASLQLRKQYNIAGVPTLIFLDPLGNEYENTRVVGFIPPEDMLARLNSVQNSSAAAPTAADQPPEAGPAPSQARLIANVETIVPGKPFRLGVYFTMEPGWYVYWKNPGDSGTEPQFTWDLPANFTIGKPDWPGPQKFAKPPFATFGHTGELLLSFEVQTPADIQPGEQLVFKANASWLVCKEICIGQKDNLQLQLPVATQSLVAAEHEAKFNNAARMTPQPSAAWSLSATNSVSRVNLVIEPDPDFLVSALKDSEFFPVEKGVFRHGSIKTNYEDGILKISMLRTGIPLGKKLEGVFSLPDSIACKNKFIFLSAQINKE
jgi:thiol:disulfide interchange protein DsbD